MTGGGVDASPAGGVEAEDQRREVEGVVREHDRDVLVEGAENFGGSGGGVLTEKAFDFAEKAVNGQGGGDAVAGDVDKSDEVVGAGWGGELTMEQEIAADVVHGPVGINKSKAVDR